MTWWIHDIFRYKVKSAGTLIRTMPNN